jgi:hypothetical protein
MRRQSPHLLAQPRVGLERDAPFGTLPFTGMTQEEIYLTRCFSGVTMTEMYVEWQGEKKAKGKQ